MWVSEWVKSHSVVSDSLRPHGLHNPWNSPGQNTGVGSLFLLQGIFPTQELNPGLLHCTQILYQLSHKGSPRILEWVAYPFSSRSSWPRNQTRVSWIAEGFFTNWATRDSLLQNFSWSKIWLPVQGTWVQFLVQEDCTCCRHTKSGCPSYWSPHVLESMLSSKGGQSHEKPGTAPKNGSQSLEVDQITCTAMKAQCSQK